MDVAAIRLRGLGLGECDGAAAAGLNYHPAFYAPFLPGLLAVSGG